MEIFALLVIGSKTALKIQLRCTSICVSVKSCHVWNKARLSNVLLNKPNINKHWANSFEKLWISYISTMFFLCYQTHDQTSQWQTMLSSDDAGFTTSDVMMEQSLWQHTHTHKCSAHLCVQAPAFWRQMIWTSCCRFPLCAWWWLHGPTLGLCVRGPRCWTAGARRRLNLFRSQKDFYLMKATQRKLKKDVQSPHTHRLVSLCPTQPPNMNN